MASRRISQKIISLRLPEVLYWQLVKIATASQHKTPSAWIRHQIRTSMRPTKEK